MEQLVITWLENAGVAAEYVKMISDIILFVGIALLAMFVNLIVRKGIVIALHRLALKSKTSWDDIIFERKVLQRLSHLAPVFVIYFMMSSAFAEYSTFAELCRLVAKLYALLIVVLVLDSFLSALNDIYNTLEISKVHPIKGYIQIVKIIVYILGVVFFISFIIGKSPLFLLGGLGALTAVIMLVFKDVILGFVGSIQLSANDMLRIGDWISMPQAGADGTVVEMNLTTVKVQNFDHTISTIPTYNLISNSFQNWRGMRESGARRIKRSFMVDVNSIKLCDDEMLGRLKNIDLIKDYIECKQLDIEKSNKEKGVSKNHIINGRRQTNIGIFRAYLEMYLKNHEAINEEMTILVRQLKMEEKGLPIEIYVFSKIQDWVQYEGVQSDIFDHVLAVIPYFDLQIFQVPSGSDFKLLGMQKYNDVKDM